MVIHYLKVDGFVCTAVTAVRDTQIAQRPDKQINQKPSPGY